LRFIRPLYAKSANGVFQVSRHDARIAGLRPQRSECALPPDKRLPFAG
jgi:hypothetical protein